MSAADDFFTPSGAGKSAKFETVGSTVIGKVVSFEQQQQTDFDGNLLFWDNGDKRMQLKVGLATDERNPEIEDDDGVRYLYVKGSKKPESKSLHVAVADALKAAGAKLEVGGTLSVTCTFKAPSPNPKKLANQYSATYQAPDFFSGEQPAAEQPAQPQQVPAPAAAAPASGGPSAEDVATAKTLIAAGLDDATVLAAASSVTPQVLAALRNAAA